MVVSWFHLICRHIPESTRTYTGAGGRASSLVSWLTWALGSGNPFVYVHIKTAQGCFVKSTVAFILPSSSHGISKNHHRQKKQRDFDSRVWQINYSNGMNTLLLTRVHGTGTQVLHNRDLPRNCLSLLIQCTEVWEWCAERNKDTVTGPREDRWQR